MPATAPRRLALLSLLVLLAMGGAAAIWADSDLYGAIFQRYTATEAGTYSDFSQSWVGTRLALFDHSDPYGPAALAPIQTLYYGHVLQADDPHRPAHPQGFYYPLYIVWLLWPLALLPFPLASGVYKLIAAGLLVGATYGYLGTLGWPADRRGRLALAAGSLLTLGGLATLRSDQPSVLVYGLLLGAVIAASRGRYGWLGALLALAWIKPQLAALPTLSLALWCLAVPVRRRALFAGALTGGALLLSSEWLLPGWMGAWRETFTGYVAATSGFDPARPGDWLGVAVRVGLALVAGALWWAVRRAEFADPRTQIAVAATLVFTATMQQPWFNYNLIFLYPPLLCLLAWWRRPGMDRAYSSPALLGSLALGIFALQWGGFLLLYGAYLAGSLATTGLDWPGFAAVYLLAARVVIDFSTLLLLFAYLAWLPLAFQAPRPTVEPGLVT